MGKKYFIAVGCTHCQRINYDVCYAPSSDLVTWKCKYCGKKFNIEDGLDEQALADYADEAERDSKALEDLVNSFAKKPPALMPVISQLAIAIEETLVVYHEPHFVRWACRCLQGIVDKRFSPIKYMSDEVASSWAGKAVTECVSAARQPVPEFSIEDASTAIEYALRAQDVLAKENNKKENQDVNRE